MNANDRKYLAQQIDSLLADMRNFGTVKPLSERQRKKRIAQCADDPALFAELYFPHRVYKDAADASLLTEEHRELFRLCNLKNVPVLFLLYRKFGKSTLGTIIDTLHKIVYARFHAGVIGSFDKKTAIDNFTSAILLELEVNDRLRQDFGDLTGADVWRLDNFITKSKIRLAARGIREMLKGFNNPLNGQRLDMFKGDDLQKRESARSAPQVRALMDWLWEEAWPALRPRAFGGGYFNILGTCVNGGTDAMTQMKDDADRPMVKLVVPMELTRPSTVRTVTADGVTERVISAADGQPHWKRLFALQDCRDERNQVGNHIYEAEYQQQPLTAAHRTFRVKEWLPFLAPDGVIPRPDFAQHTQFGTRADPSFTAAGCRKAIVILSSQPGDRRMYLRHVFLRQCSNLEFLTAIEEIGGLYGCLIRIEENSLKDWLWDDVKAYEQEHQTVLNLAPVHNYLNKDARIGQLQSPMQRGLFVAQKHHSDMQVLVDEADLYEPGGSGFKDGVDAWAGAYQDLLLLKRQEGQREHGLRSTGQRRPIAPTTMRAVLAGRR